jgi:hypothetical protein
MAGYETALLVIAAIAFIGYVAILVRILCCDDQKGSADKGSPNRPVARDSATVLPPAHRLPRPPGLRDPDAAARGRPRSRVRSGNC